MQSLYIFIVILNYLWTNSRVAGDLRPRETEAWTKWPSLCRRYFSFTLMRICHQRIEFYWSLLGITAWWCQRITNWTTVDEVKPCRMASLRHTDWMYCDDVIMSATASQITSLTTVYSTVFSSADQRKHQNSASLVFVRGIHPWPVNSPHKGSVTRKMFPFDDVIMCSVTNFMSVDDLAMQGARQFSVMTLVLIACNTPKLGRGWCSIYYSWTTITFGRLMTHLKPFVQLFGK